MNGRRALGMLFVFLFSICLPGAIAQQAPNSTSQPTPDSASQQGPKTSPGSSPAPAPAPAPLPTPSITGPLEAAPPIIFEAGPLGKLAVNGVLSGMGLVQENHSSGDDTGEAALSNGQIFLQKPDGWWQFYVQAGAYNILALGTPFLSTQKAISDLWGPVPVAYLKLQGGSRTRNLGGNRTSILAGALPALMGQESTFDFQNMNIERGLLWNQENSINRGIQVNFASRLSASFSWNDGYYSNRYSWLSGSLTYTDCDQSDSSCRPKHALSFVGMGNLGQTGFQTLATPVQNNGRMYTVQYTYKKYKNSNAVWIVQPYYQYGEVPSNRKIGISAGAWTQGGAVLVNRAFTDRFSLSGRGEYIAASGSASEQSVNLLYGPGSAAWSITATPTYQRERFFVRGDVSYVRAISYSAGSAFGGSGTEGGQARGVVESGFLF